MNKKQEKEISRRRFLERQAKRQREVEYKKRIKERESKRKDEKQLREANKRLEVIIELDEIKINEKSLNHLFTLANMHVMTNPELAQFYMWQFRKLARNNAFGIFIHMIVLTL